AVTMRQKVLTVVGYVIMVAAVIVLLVLALAGCTTTGRAKAAVAREAQTPHFHPAQAIEPLIAFQRAVEQQSAAGGLEPEQFGLIMRWVGASLTTLRGPHPEEWEATARAGWPSVRSAVGPFETLSPFVRLIDSLIE